MASPYAPHLQGSSPLHNFLNNHCNVHSLAVPGPNALLMLCVVSAALQPILNLNKTITWICFWSNIISISSVQSLSCIDSLWPHEPHAARQASLSVTKSRSSLKPVSIESMMPSSHLILCRPLFLLPSIFPRIRVFFKWVSSLHQVAKVLEFQLPHQSFKWTPRTDLL